MFKPDEEMQQIVENNQAEEMSEIAELSKSFKDIDIDEAKISLSTFEIYLLPYILKELEHNDANNMVFINNLKDLVGGYRTTILVVDDNDASKIIFKLPPMITSTNIEGLEKAKLRNAIVSFEQVKESNPRAADINLKAVTKAVVKGMSKDGEKLAEYRKYSTEFYEYYKNRINKDSSIKEATETNSINSNDDDFLDELEF